MPPLKLMILSIFIGTENIGIMFALLLIPAFINILKQLSVLVMFKINVCFERILHKMSELLWFMDIELSYSCT